jgi:hypothetical protein
VLQPDYLKAVDAIVSGAPIADLQAYFRWHLVHASALMLPAAFRQIDFDFFGRTLRGQQSPPLRWRECVSRPTSGSGSARQGVRGGNISSRAKSDTLAMNDQGGDERTSPRPTG